MSLPVPDRVPHLWAKSPLPGQPRGQTLLEHTWQVLARLRDLASLRPELPQQTGVPRLWHLLFWAAFLHDWGKSARGFQAVLRRRARRWPYRHEVLSLAFVDWLSADLTAAERLWLAAAIATHHKDFAELEDYTHPWDTESDPLPLLLADLPAGDAAALHAVLTQDAPRWVQALGVEAWGVTAPQPPPAAEALAALTPDAIRRHLLAIEQQLAAWEDLAADHPHRLPPLLRPGVLLRGLLVQSDHLGSAEVGPLPQVGWQPAQVLASGALSWSRLYPHQRAAARTEGHAWLTAPTGAGKTEAALLWAARQSPPRLFYTLPYQASMNAMYDRLCRLFGPERVGLLHGRSTLSLYQRLMAQEYAPDAAARTARELRNKAGLAYYPIRVFSPYQMLKAAFQLKGYEALLADFAHAAFVFDEIHAYEPERLAMILETVRYLAAHYGARFLVMSATLPAPVRERWLDAVGDATAIPAPPEVYRRFRRHRLHLLDGDLLDPEPLQRILNCVQQAGRQTLVVCNTVQRAQQVWGWLAARLPPEIPCLLLHSRFTGEDRAAKEKAILQAAGLGQRDRRPLVVVATQVVEVSLNLDLDVLFSDPAPLEALLQRFGRVNRLGTRPPAPVYVCRAIDEGSRAVYRPAEQIERTLEVLSEAVQATAPEEGHLIDESRLPAWLDALYTGPVLAAWQSRYRQTADEFRRDFLHALRPWQSNPGLQAAFDRLFDGTEVLPEAFYDAYLDRRESAPLTASHLLVPISWGQYHRLRRDNRLLPGDDDLPPVARVPYSAARGLEIP